jgi:benzoyl-CoA reductase subunit A
MKLFVGIDLGSTTTKAVVMDEQGDILGRGITNSRSNYDTACAIAKTEAFIATRFTLFQQGLGRQATNGQGGGIDSEALLPALEGNFRLRQYQRQLEYLSDAALGEADGYRIADLRKPLREKLEALFVRIAEEAREIFEPGGVRKSEFFRDIAGNAYMNGAVELADPDGVTYDMLVNIFDKCIIRVENTMLDLSFEGNIADALEATFATENMENTENTDKTGKGGPLPKQKEQDAFRAAAEAAAETQLNVVNTVGTGYGRARLPFPKEQIRSEILCHGLGAHFMYPDTKTVLDIGGQDTKAIQVDNEGIVTSFQMNDRCAAGRGRYLGYIADELNMGVQELGPLAMKSNKSVRINSTCTVFAGAELRERLNNGERREDILQGLHRAIILRAMSLLARSGGIDDEFTFTGGVANNQAAVHALTGLVEDNYGERVLNISPDSIYTGAIGAALFSRMDRV